MPGFTHVDCPDACGHSRVKLATPGARRRSPRNLMSYHAPVLESFFFLEHCTSLKRLAASGAIADLTPDLVKSVLEGAGKFADGVLAPLNRVGDQEGTLFENGVVRTPKGWKEAYKAWTEAGWNGLGASPEYGGQGLPSVVSSACFEFWSAACMAWG